ncbi:uncharacterized protein PGTG_17492 [Puccinia graminis f. sp. tritici CRL 75-36-700-3]|uniref:Uncharacterized protein n=1 Tax=Puccinia graminis f. sp. tritici (strain CRL 75-36-700-3 / race SCCL) TaxID=418459 RepID=E3L5D0_PUCGT|nr:uncharacterized protein PGTG_17492 [Puccinia graminis f. sp. tritici CRL 75-36-700-3]EFP91755.1 hypothetical protein PGTG_17492 [Puccinia graminis f. sp. tritici CRL 75-36-700-3]
MSAAYRRATHIPPGGHGSTPRPRRPPGFKAANLTSADRKVWLGRRSKMARLISLCKVKKAWIHLGVYPDVGAWGWAPSIRINTHGLHVASSTRRPRADLVRFHRLAVVRRIHHNPELSTPR